MTVELHISGVIELGDFFAAPADLAGMSDTAILVCWGEDPLDDLLQGLRVRVVRDGVEGREYLFERWDRPALVEWKKP